MYVPCHHDSIPESLLFPQNAVHNIVSVPKKPAKIVVDTVGGDKLDLEPSGLEPKFVHKKVHNKYWKHQILVFISFYNSSEVGAKVPLL